MENQLHLGIDAGSTTVCTVILNRNKQSLFEDYRCISGQPLVTVAAILELLKKNFSFKDIASLSLTGSGGKAFLPILGGDFINEIIAHGRAIAYFHPEVRTVIEIGGEDSKLIFLSPTADGYPRIVDFAMNTLCAAGTGAFLEQQAYRLGISIEELSRLALEAGYPARIAGRCAVFAKSDMIHLQQEATPLPEIVAGLCYALARNLKSNIGRGKPFLKPVAFQGGVAANFGMRRAFCDILHLSEGELIIPRHFLTMGAIGAALWALGKKNHNYIFPGMNKLYEAIERRNKERRSWPPLELKKSLFKKVFPSLSADKKTKAYLGIDVGSISTNLVVLDEKKRLLCKKYLMTAGKPLEAVKQGLREIGEELKDKLEILGVCTTGSGRFLVGDFVGADIIKNEITAQAEAAVEIYPQVDTIFEIGGQDSKFIQLENGTVIDFQMNSACAAGTGSFLEEQAEQLGISIVDDFGNLALSAQCPAPLGERCTVFMKSDLVHYQQRGTSKEDSVAGLCYAIVQNYLNKVVGNKKIGKHILFQGGVADNEGVVAAFEQLLGKPIIVPEHREVTGAIGAALLAMRERDWEGTRFKGFELAHVKYGISAFVCKACPNHCEIKKVSIEGDKPLFYGGRCEKYEVDRRGYKKVKLPNLIEERNELLEKHAQVDSGTGMEIGLPMVFFFHDLLPFFSTLLKELGFRVTISDPTTKETIKQGVEAVVAETCYPVKVAHGKVSNLIQKGIKYIFLPAIIDLPPIHKDFSLGMLCPYVEALPYMLKAAFPFNKPGAKLIDPVLYLGRQGWYKKESIKNLAKSLKLSTNEVANAWEKAEFAQSEYRRALRKRGDDVLRGLKDNDLAIVIVGRPYNSFDDGVNLRIPQKLIKRGITVLPLDALPLSEVKEIGHISDFYWHYGQNIVAAAKIIRKDPRLYAVYITNFACGPDSFVLHFFGEEMQGKPFLEIEIDEHSADAGVVTRLEAFLDSIKGKRKPPSIKKYISTLKYSRYERKVYIPYMCDHAFALAAAFEGCGVTAKVLPPSDQKSLELGRSLSSGKECYPCILTTGDMIKMTQMPEFDPKHSAFFMPSGSGPCRFGQYHRFQRIILDELGYHEVPIHSPNQDGGHYEELGMVADDFIRWSWRGVVSVDLLNQLLRTTRPYEKISGETERVYRDGLDELCNCLREKREPISVLAGITKRFKEIPRSEKRKPPIGIVGEIYIRSNPFANEDITRQIEDLGGEVWMPPVGEWIFYTNHTAILRVWRQRYIKKLLRLLIINFIQHKEEHKLRRALKGGLKDGKEPLIFRMLSWAKPYLDPAFEGEAVLSIGKTIDFLRKGAVGIINVMPFTCMPGTIVQAILKRVKEEHRAFPCLNLIFDGQGKTNIQTRLEAFMHQVQQFYETESGS